MNPSPRPLTLGERTRRVVGKTAIDVGLRSLSRVGRMHPLADPARHGVEVLRDVPYRADPQPHERLDVYRPIERNGPAPAVLYIHGGGFRILSKNTHWMMGLAFARRGFVVFNIDYRLAPRHPYPAALEDAARAYTWLIAHGAEYGADASRILVAGESAGANLTAALAVLTCYRRPEPWTKAVWDTGRVPVAALPACGILQVSDHERFRRRKKLRPWLADRIAETCEAYLGVSESTTPNDRALADPLVIFESGEKPERPLPPFFAGVGTRDPLLDDTRRLQVALDRLGVPCRTRYYPGEVHAFEALVWRPQAQRFWNDTFAFLTEHGIAPPRG